MDAGCKKVLSQWGLHSAINREENFHTADCKIWVTLDFYRLCKLGAQREFRLN